MKLELTQDSLEVRLEAWEKALAVRLSGPSIPLDDIISVRTVPPDFSWKDLRMPGTSLPGVIRAGSYLARRPGDARWVREFWYWTRGKEHLVLELDGGRYGRVVLGVEDSAYWADLLGDARAKRRRA